MVQQYPKRSLSAIKAQYNSGLVGRRRTWNALIEEYKKGNTDLSAVVYVGWTKDADQLQSPDTKPDPKFWTQEEKNILLDILAEENGTLMNAFRKFHLSVSLCAPVCFWCIGCSILTSLPLIVVSDSTSKRPQCQGTIRQQRSMVPRRTHQARRRQEF